MKILVINPGSTSTKIAVYSEEASGKLKSELDETISHSREELSPFTSIMDQLTFRKGMIVDTLKEAGYQVEEMAGIAARGGLFKPVTGGTYRVNEDMVADLRAGYQGEHASNLAGVMAFQLEQETGVPAFVVDPVAIDEFVPESRISGIPELPRQCLSHALNIKAVARKAAGEMGWQFAETNFVVAHLGGGCSIAPLDKGRIVDVNNGNEGGPFTPERAGTVPAGGLLKLAYSGDYTYQQLKKKLVGEGGLYAYLGTADGREIEARIAAGDSEAELIYSAMVYQIAKEIGAMAAVLKGDVAAILLTGGLAHSSFVVEGIKERVSYIAPVRSYPGGMEMEALCRGVLRVLKGEEESKLYS
ncbi:MAG: butyrate kinase [Halanaerobium sp.]|nr:butyrate kinase [Halanaerobium sp.]